MRKLIHRGPGRRGFALVVSLLLLVLLAAVVLGLLGLSAIELRKSAREEAAAQARANARLALMQALGQLQRTLGPDQRVSAMAEILGPGLRQPQWTGVWSSVRPSGASWFSRDDAAGGLRDGRWPLRPEPADQALEWLVSGNADPRTALPGRAVRLLTVPDGPVVSAPRVAVRGGGHLAWWTGDLGVRANLRVADPREGIEPDAAAAETGGWFRLMASQAADLPSMTGGGELTAPRSRLASAGSLALAGAGRSWPQRHSLDFTTDSAGVLADVAHGGLKSDLTAYFENGPVAAWKGRPGLADADPLLARGETASRLARGGPCFGILRDWATLAAPFSGEDVGGRLPETDPAAGRESAELALANETPVKLAGNRRAPLQPVLVEASNFTQMSCYQMASEPEKQFQLRQLMYPRVVLWNPYNCELTTGRYIIMIQGNGRQEMWTENENINDLPWFFFGNTSQWLNFEGGRSTSFNSPEGIMNSEGYNDPYMGSYFFSIPATRFGPGECLVFSPRHAAEYDGLSAYRPGSYNLNANELSCTVPPDPSRAYYVSATDIGGGINFLPRSFWYAPTDYWSLGGRHGVENQSDDTRAILKHVGENEIIKFEDFDKLPQAVVLSASLQYGAGREPRIEWSGYEKMPIELLDRERPRPTVVPNVRTREGIRLRWFDEHESNRANSGPLSNTAYLEEAVLANWNPRASFIVRSPWENVGGTLPVNGPGGGPWFFGAYTRDLYDATVGWDEQMPVPRGGRQHGNPFGPPQEGQERVILFDVPRAATGVVSLGQFQHAPLSPFVWHPSYAVGNSLADPRAGLTATAAESTTPAAAAHGGFGADEIGWSTDAERSGGRDAWAATARAMLGGLPESDNLVYDLSFEANQALWDRFFLSTGSAAEKAEFLADPAGKALPNGRIRPLPGATAEAVGDFHRAAGSLLLDGAFNVNSTRVEAWKALLGSTRSGSRAAFPRVLNPPAGGWAAGDGTEDDAAWAGRRELTTGEIDLLATAIVAEVKRRGPFLSLADFVNRRLAGDETGRMGALQAAIEKAGLNAGFTADFPLENGAALPDYSHPDHLPDATRLDQTLKPACKAWGAPGYLTQADVLQVLGPALAARSDTFVIRAYGEAAGPAPARAWCEAVVQRLPEPLAPDESGLDSRHQGKPGDFGRRFVITSFRWLAPNEI